MSSIFLYIRSATIFTGKPWKCEDPPEELKYLTPNPSIKMMVKSPLFYTILNILNVAARIFETLTQIPALHNPHTAFAHQYS